LHTKLNGHISRALIIAAGQGSRLHSITNGKPKPLTRILGLSLIERVIINAKKSGVDECTIVVGYEGNEIKNELGDGSNYGVRITYIENTEWNKGNGVSVLKAKGILGNNNHGKFFLLMSDHIFEQKILEDLKKLILGQESSVLVVDEKPKKHIDLVDATKVRIENGYIMDIGKKIENYNGVDCGIFLLSPSAIFQALEESRKNNDDTLSGGIRILGKNKQIRNYNINGHLWIDVDTETDYIEAEKMLLNNLRPDKTI
jgi:1L-myo-inositol 1-phosphate cytidylyltransferase / CDP-L-myo-inositol myo-inositolphosphotransferase